MENRSAEQVKRPIVMLANGHPPFDTRIFIKEARSLVQAGYTVSMILPHTQDTEKDGVRLYVVKPLGGGFDKLFVSPWRILGKALKQPARSVFCIHDSDILGVGLILKLFGRKVVYDAHEDTPLQISYQHWLPRWLRGPYATFYYLLEKLCGAWFDAIIVAEPVIAQYFPKNKTYLIRNFPLAHAFRTHVPVPYGTRPQVLTSVGTLSKVRGLIEMLEGARLAASRASFEFVLGGKFAPQSLQAEVLKHYTVRFLEWLSFDAMVEVLFASRVGIIIPNPIERYKTNYPVKMFEFMAAGLPVIASSAGESAAFIKEADAGILVDPLNVQEVADAIVWLFTHPAEAEAMGQRGQALIFSKYNWEKENETLLKVYSSISS
ncbi:glycosyltransferase family 4 protein [Parachryseolinea silvisoli]|uniref:glycosyltransferase family 4 protein n=1 Tax=Parachryseolinea silvisoli TaxID=2873601 RepID=UPI002265A603|nr:glycosyltransferase family 4 protein [Parachryseolinea silvisoli]MCD9019067.1 glycosyltransferase family 4 protein [Parachryseolinea silvisoli]